MKLFKKTLALLITVTAPVWFLPFLLCYLLVGGAVELYNDVLERLEGKVSWK